MAFDFDNVEENTDKNLTSTFLKRGIEHYTDDDASVNNLKIDNHEFLKNKGCFCAKKGFYYDGRDFPNGSGEYYIIDPKYYLEKDGEIIPEAANFSIINLEPDRQDISKPIAKPHIPDEELEYPALVFQQLVGEIKKEGVFKSNDASLNKRCYVFLGIYKIHKLPNNSSGLQEYQFIKIGDTFYFDPSKKR